jgi:CobQ-like glutamine amidotransferase family enzyme
MSARESAVRICVPYPELLGTYGDGGNGVVLAQRLRWRGYDAEIVSPALADPLPQDCDVYLLGGGEDAPQTLATDQLRAHDLAAIADRGAVVFAVCAGLQLLGRSFTDARGATVPGLGLLDCTTRPKGSRMIGELVVDATAFSLPRLTGFENHGGITELGPAAVPLGRVMAGSGNGAGGVEGVVQGRVVGTYLHGPCLARNPALADLLLGWVVGEDLAPLDDGIVDVLRTERLHAALGRRA